MMGTEHELDAAVKSMKATASGFEGLAHGYYSLSETVGKWASGEEEPPENAFFGMSKALDTAAYYMETAARLAWKQVDIAAILNGTQE